MKHFRKKKDEGEQPYAGQAADDGAPQDSGISGDAGADFFDLPSDQVADHKPSGIVVAENLSLKLKPLLKTLVPVVVAGVLIAGIALVWPSSTARMPGLAGRTLTEAMDAARVAGFVPCVNEWKYSERHSDGIVLAQKPGAMRTVKKGASVKMTVSKGPRPEEGLAPGENVSEQPKETPAGPYSGTCICVDAGNQLSPGEDEWSDPGMTRKNSPEDQIRGVTSSNPEYSINLDIAMKLKNLLEKDGMKVVMTRESNDVELSNVNRAEIANNARADLFLRIHCGSSTDSSRQGVETLYPDRNNWTQSFYEKSKAAALFIQAELLKTCGAEDLGAVVNHDLSAFNWSKTPVAQAEPGLLSNPRDDSLLSQDDFRWKVAWGLRNGIVKYLANH
ncbi:MAG: hypothetical protein CVT63_07785 [Candidatus Anoxymicrobium japonicum]|uniref:PASTA domain-containing protein n=1 Tax=Candidatus Anoxymicrobium japonicum TaxID=2013648 RepID=A0A2N3G414_9ACTN|nr:MAG: hypothetical protein CVT63_07785 [Candidatus Anoxymicrobium japonicum]